MLEKSRLSDNEGAESYKLLVMNGKFKKLLIREKFVLDKQEHVWHEGKALKMKKIMDDRIQDL